MKSNEKLNQNVKMEYELEECWRNPTAEERSYVSGYLLNDAKKEKRSDLALSIFLICLFCSFIWLSWKFATEWKFDGEPAEHILNVAIPFIFLVIGLWSLYCVIRKWLLMSHSQYEKHIIAGDIQVVDVEVCDIEDKSIYVESNSAVVKTAIIKTADGCYIAREMCGKRFSEADNMPAEMFIRRPIISVLQEGPALLAIVKYGNGYNEYKASVIPTFSQTSEYCQKYARYFQEKRW